MSVSTIRRYGAAALVIGMLFCAFLVALFVLMLAWEGQSTAEHQWFVLLVAMPVCIQLYLKRSQILHHVRSHFVMWFLSVALCLVVALQLGQLSQQSGANLGDQFRDSFFSWIEGSNGSSATVKNLPSNESYLVPFPSKGFQPSV